MNKKSNFLTFLIMSGLIATFLLTSGCTAPQEDGATNELVVAISTDVNNWYLDKFPGGDGRFVWSQVYETLVRLDTDLNIVPGLAESWETPDDGKTWIFHLRDDVSFHDGTPFDANSVVFSYSNESYVKKMGALKALDHIEIIDDSTVKFVMKKPMPLPFYLTHVAWPVMSPGCVDENGNFAEPIGTGPFKFEEQTPDQEIVLVRNDNYWGDKPVLETVTFKVIPEATTRVMALETKEVDMAIKLPEYDVSRLEEEPDINVYRKLTTFTDFLQFNCNSGVFEDKEVRKAVAYSINTEQMLNTVLEGIGLPARGRAFSPVMMYSNPDLELYEYDVEKARDILSEAGWQDSDNDGVLEKEGEPLKATIIVGKGVWASRHIPMAEAIQGTLQKVGMDADIKVLESGAINKLENEGQFDVIFRTGYFVWGPYPRHFFVHQSYCPFSHYNNTEYDKLANAADSTVDPEKQQQLYYDLQDMVLEELPAFYLVHEEKIIAANTYVKGYQITAEDPWLNLDGVYLEEEQ
ncbi:ABC transporter substrate-binding protein [Methanococcoides sp.]|uniref:ABC transporter substrate-binding protein n=1 Tax=Methanococcoides sp. TaxID=1966350 RepID=UPI00272E2667|nr:ABC transporter substrate-binding protein [Methanococcoides sp.]